MAKYKTTKLSQAKSPRDDSHAYDSYIRVPRSVQKAAKIAAAQREISMRELVTEAVTIFLREPDDKTAAA